MKVLTAVIVTLGVLAIAAFLFNSVVLVSHGNSVITCASGRTKSLGCGTELGWVLTSAVALVTMVVGLCIGAWQRHRKKVVDRWYKRIKEAEKEE